MSAPEQAMVTQADRDAACAYLSEIAGLRGADAVAAIRDDHPAVQALARHRIAAEAELVRVLRETREQLDRVQGSDFDFDVDAALYEADRLLAKHGGGRPCRYCQNGQYTGLPGNACENCMNTGVEH